jgi:hypothetical protein
MAGYDVLRAFDMADDDGDSMVGGDDMWGEGWRTQNASVSSDEEPRDDGSFSSCRSWGSSPADRMFTTQETVACTSIFDILLMLFQRWRQSRQGNFIRSASASSEHGAFSGSSRGLQLSEMMECPSETLDTPESATDQVTEPADEQGHSQTSATYDASSDGSATATSISREEEEERALERREETKKQRRDRNNLRRQREKKALLPDEPSLFSVDKALTEAKLNCKLNRRDSKAVEYACRKPESTSKKTTIFWDIENNERSTKDRARKHTRTHTGMCIANEEGSVADYRFMHVFSNRPFGLTFKKNERMHASFSSSSFATTQISSSSNETVLSGDLLLKLGEEDITGVSLKGLFAKMKGATLPLTMTFCRVPEDQVWTAEANSNSPRHGQTPTTLPETDTDQTPYACAPDAGRKGQGGKGGRGRQTSRDALGGFGMPPKGAGVHLGGSSGGMKNHARVQSESQTMPVLAALVAEVAKSRHQRRGHVRGNTAPDVISKLHHVAPEPRKEPPPVSMKEQVELRPWYSGKGLSVI